MGVLNYNETDPFPPQPPDFALIYPYPQLGNVNIYESRAAANYHALQARLERRLANGFTGLVSYTFQQTLTDLDVSSAGVAVGAGAGLQTIKDIHANYGPARFDRPHRLVASWLYELPFFKNRNDLLGRVAGDWQIGAIGTFQDGPVSDAVLVWRPVRRVPRQSARRPEPAARRADDRSMVRRQPAGESGARSAR